MYLPSVRRKMLRTRPREWKRLVLTSSVICSLPWHCAQRVKLADNSFEKRGSLVISRSSRVAIPNHRRDVCSNAVHPLHVYCMCCAHTASSLLRTHCMCTACAVYPLHVLCTHYMHSLSQSCYIGIPMSIP